MSRLSAPETRGPFCEGQCKGLEELEGFGKAAAGGGGHEWSQGGHWDPRVKHPETWVRPYVSLAGRYERANRLLGSRDKVVYSLVDKEVGEYGIGIGRALNTAP